MRDWMMHTDTVAGSLLDLETVGEGLALAEVDEVGLVTGRVSKGSVQRHAC